MEKALFLDVWGGAPDPSTRGFDRLYLGAESCHWMLPGLHRLRAVRRHCERSGIALTLVTPLLSPGGLPRARALLDELPAGAEVVVNDWGLLEDVRAAGLVPVLGRLLIKTGRDPRIGPSDLADPVMVRHLRDTNLAEPAFLQFLDGEGIRRVELDNVPQGWEIALPAAMRASFHFPRVYASTTWRCGMTPEDPEARVHGHCRRTCRRRHADATVYADPTRAVMLSATYRYRAGQLSFENPVLPTNLGRWNVDRIVVHEPHDAASGGGSADLAAWDGLHARLGSAVPWGYDKVDRRLVDRVVRHAPVARPRTLDLGCGNGRNAVALAAAGCDLVGLDASATALAHCRARVPDVPLVLGDAANLPFGRACFDVVMDSGCLHAIPPSRHGDYAEGIRRVLAPDGVFVAFARRRDPAMPATDPVFLVDGGLAEWGFTPEQVARMLGGDFALVEATSHDGQTGETFWYLVFRRAGDGTTAGRAAVDPGWADVSGAGAPDADGTRQESASLRLAVAAPTPAWPREGFPSRAALRELAARHGFDWQGERVEGTRVVIELSGPAGGFRVVVFPATDDAPCYRAAGRWKVAYQGPMPGGAFLDELLAACGTA